MIENSISMKYILTIPFCFLLVINLLCFVFGILDTRNCGLVSKRICVNQEKELILSHSRWKYVVPGYNVGVNFGYFMNEGEIK